MGLTMTDDEQRVLTPDVARRSLRVVYWSLFASLPVYALVVLVLPTPEGWDPAVHTDWTAVAIFAALALIAGAAIPYLRRRMFFKPLEEGEIERRSEQYLLELRTTSAATWALATSISILGLLAYLAIYQFWMFALFFIPSAALFIVFRPPDDLIDEMQRPPGA